MDLSPNYELVIPEGRGGKKDIKISLKFGKINYFLMYCSLNSRHGIWFLFSWTFSLPITDNNCSSHPTVQKPVYIDVKIGCWQVQSVAAKFILPFSHRGCQFISPFFYTAIVSVNLEFNYFLRFLPSFKFSWNWLNGFESSMRRD